MSKKILLVFVFSIIAIGFIGAISVSEYSCENIIQYKTLAIGQTLPDKAPFTDEIINIYLSEEIYGNLQIENKTLSGFTCKENENATYEIHIQNLGVVEDFINSDDFLETYKEKSSSGEIDVKGIGLGNKFKLFFAKIFLKFY